MSSILSKLINLAGNITGVLPVVNGGTGVTSSTGTVAVVLSTSPTLVTPLLGTPTSGNLSNCTNYPAANTTTAGTVTYEDSGSFTITYSGPAALSVTYNYTRVGKVVCLRWAQSVAASGNNVPYDSNSSNFPSALRPAAAIDLPVPVMDNGSAQSTMGYLELATNGASQIGKTFASGNFTNTGNAGLLRSCTTYTVQ